MPFLLTRNRIIILGLGALLIVGLIVGFITFRRATQDPSSVTLTVWGVFDSRDAYSDIIAAYRDIRPNVRINYVQKKYQLNEAEQYERELVNALATGEGPDLFMFHNTWLPKHTDKIRAFDAELQTYFQVPFGDFRDRFPQVITQDFTRDTTIYASPLYLDTLALFYNRDFFDRKGVASPPATWTEFESAVPRLREINPATNEIVRAAAAIGGSERSINRSSDLLSLVMAQRGTTFTDANFNRATFDSERGLDALRYFTQFANPTSPVYTWNERFPYSVDSFASGNTAMIFNYAHQIPAIEAKNAFLNYRVAPMPQVAGATQPVNYANYWGLAASKQSQAQGKDFWAWDFILFATTRETSADIYTKETGKPPALLSLVDRNLTDPTLGIFSRQALTARSWRQIDNVSIEKIFSDMVAAVLRGEALPIALERAADEISLLMGR